MSSTLPTKSLLAGACLAADTKVGTKCAYQPLDCSASEIFVSPLWLEQNNPQWATRCGSQLAVRIIQGLGRCQNESEDYLCTSDSSACVRPLAFERPVNDCNLLQDSFGGTNYDIPHFGRCAHTRNPARDFCAWSKEDCKYDDATANEEFVFQVADPSRSAGRGGWGNCECKDVHVGACVNEGANAIDSVWYCAVSENACSSTRGEEDFRYYPVLEFQAYSKKSCRLCDGMNIDIPPSPSPVEPNPTASQIVSPKTPIINPVAPAPTFGPVVSAPTFGPVVPTSTFSTPSTISNDRNNAGIVIGSVIGGLTAAAAMALIILAITKGVGARESSNMNTDDTNGAVDVNLDENLDENEPISMSKDKQIV